MNIMTDCWNLLSQNRHNCYFAPNCRNCPLYSPPVFYSGFFIKQYETKVNPENKKKRLILAFFFNNYNDYRFPTVSDNGFHLLCIGEGFDSSEG